MKANYNMDKINIDPKILVGILIIGLVMISGCTTNKQFISKEPIKLDFDCPENEVIRERNLSDPTEVTTICTGIEEHKINGIHYELCCWVIEYGGEEKLTPMKKCANYNPFKKQDYIKDKRALLLTEVEGRWLKVNEYYTENGKDCIIQYDLEGNIKFQSCYPHR